MLTQAEIDQYRRDGFVTPDFTLAQDVVDSLRNRHRQLLSRHPQFEQYCPALLAYDTGFLHVARDPAILDMVSQLIGDNIALWNSSLFAKPANSGHATPWHQDGEYWPIRPLATCTVWIALDDATPDNGCLQVIPGSHQDQTLLAHHTNNSQDLTLHLELDNDSFNATAAQNIILKTGQISLHDVYLVHGSKANHSTESRRGMTLRYMPTTSVYDHCMPGTHEDSRLSMSQRTLYLMRGTDISTRNDFSVKH